MKSPQLGFTDGHPPLLLTGAPTYLLLDILHAPPMQDDSGEEFPEYRKDIIRGILRERAFDL